MEALPLVPHSMTASIDVFFKEVKVDEGHQGGPACCDWCPYTSGDEDTHPRSEDHGGRRERAAVCKPRGEAQKEPALPTPHLQHPES